MKFSFLNYLKNSLSVASKKLFKRSKESESRRGFLKGLAAAPLIASLPISPQPKVEAAANAPKQSLTDLEKAILADADLGSPYLYVYASQDIDKGDAVMRDWRASDPYTVKKGSFNGLPSMFIGIACDDIPKHSFGWIQDVGHMPIQPEKKITR